MSKIQASSERTIARAVAARRYLVRSNRAGMGDLWWGGLP